MEIRAARVQVGQSANVPSIFFGGGTPSLMQPDDIGRVISTIKSKFKLLPDAEITMECTLILCLRRVCTLSEQLV
jgi:oxygen-independent coproporphyrinogen-3 oxidase